MSILDQRVYNGLKDNLRKAIANIIGDDLPYGEMPFVLVDFYQWDVFYFEDEEELKDYIQSKHISGNPDILDGEDSELIVYQFCDEELRSKYENLYGDFSLLKEIDGKKVYAQRSPVSFESETIINIHI